MDELALSVAIITQNEEANLPRCLASLPPKCEVIIVDGGSTDQTVILAKAAGAKVFHRNFTNYAEQKNFACDQATRTWVLSLDADETLHASLCQAITKIVTRNPSPHAPLAYRVYRKLVFMNRVMRFGKTTDRPIRLFQRGRARFENAIHERLTFAGAPSLIDAGFLYHHSYRDLDDYFLRFNRYTNRIAEQHHAQGHRVGLCSHLTRPGVEFFYRYILRGGFLDGYPGYVYALISSLYAFIKYAKLRERILAKNESET